MSKHAPKRSSRYLLDFGKEIESRRGYRRMSQQRLAELAGTTQATISAIEHGRGNPTAGLLADITAVFGSDLEIKFKDWQS